MKFCKDINCSRGGTLLRLGEFPQCRRNDDGRYIYCKACCVRRSRALRAAKGARERKRKELGIERKPMVLAKSFTAFSKVYDAITRGCRTREEIRIETKLDYDLIGDALVELTFDCKAIRIQGREFHLAA